MEFNDDSRVDAKAIEALPGVISVVERGGQFQIVVGNNVQQTFRALQKAIGQPLGKPGGQPKNKAKGGVFTQIISVISTTFTPVIPAITGAG